MSAGREAHYGYDENKETDDGATALEPDPSGTEQRIGVLPFTAGYGEECGAPPVPSGIICLSVIAGRHQSGADPAQLTRAIGFEANTPLIDSQLDHPGKELGLKPKLIRTRLERLQSQVPQIEIPVPSDIDVRGRFADACNRLGDLEHAIGGATDTVVDCVRSATRAAILIKEATVVTDRDVQRRQRVQSKFH